MYSRSHRGRYGMTGYRRAYGRSTVSRRFAFFGKKKCSTWSSPRERSKLKQDGTRGFPWDQGRIRESSCGHATRNRFCKKHPQSSKRGFWRWSAVQQYQRCPMGPATWRGEERESHREQSAVGCQCCSAGSTKLHFRQPGSSCQEELTSGDQWNWRGTGTRASVSGAGMRDWDSSQRTTVRSAVHGLSGHMTADDDLSGWEVASAGCCVSFLDPPLEHAETCSNAEATREHYARVHAVVCGMKLADPGSTSEFRGPLLRTPGRLIFSPPLLSRTQCGPGRVCGLLHCSGSPRRCCTGGIRS